MNRRFALAIVPEALLGPIIDGTLDRLAAVDPADVPVSLRPLLQFDRRARAGATVRRQVARAIDADAALADASAAVLLERDEIAAAARTHDPGEPVAAVAVAAARHDLDLHVAGLWASAPDGAELAVGAAIAFVHLDRALGDLEAERESALRAEHAAREALRRAQDAIEQERSRAERFAGELRDERAGRRSRDEVAAAKSDEQARRADAALARLAEETARADAASARARESAERVAGAKEALKAAQAQVRALETRLVGAVPADVVRRFAETAQSLGRELGRAVSTQSAQSSPSAQPAPSASGNFGSDGSNDVKATAAGTGRGRRPRPRVPGGLTVDAPDALDAMVRVDGVVVIVDGYNVAYVAWPEADAADKRERLGRGLVELRRRCQCEIVCVFDGDGAQAHGLRREGLQVVFSAAGQEADEVVVETARGLPTNQPVIVVSSDGWVRRGAQEAGALVVPSATLVALLRSPRR